MKTTDGREDKPFLKRGSDRRRTRRIEDALAEIEVPEVASEARATWFDFPAISMPDTRQVARPRPLAAIAGTIVLIVLIYLRDGASAFAQAARRVAHPPAVPTIGISLILPTDPETRFMVIGISVGVVILGLAVYLTWRSDDKNARKNALGLVLQILAVLIFMFVILPLTHMVPILDLLIVLTIPGLFIALVLYTIWSTMSTQSQTQGFRAWREHFQNLLIWGLFFWIIEMGFMGQILGGKSCIFWLIAIVEGWMLAPVLIRRNPNLMS